MKKRTLMKLKPSIKYLLLLSLLQLSTSQCFTQDQCLGINLDAVGAFVNIMNHTNRYVNVNSFDANGWPAADFELVLMDNRPVAEWANQIDDPEEYRVDYSGLYKGSFKGQSNLNIFGSDAVILNKSYNAASNTTYFELNIPGPPGPNHGFVYMTFSGTQKNQGGPTNTGVTELKVVRPDYDLNTTQVFTTEYLNLCNSVNFSCYRYYNVQNIWDSEPAFPQTTTWDKRKTPQDACQTNMVTLNGKRDAWCWEYIILLANTLKKDIWINIPISCDSNYVIQLATKLQDELLPDIKIYVENSNECWAPTQNTHGVYNQAQANQYGIGFNENYARRTVELSELFSQVFGKDQINKRIRVICAGQQAYLGRTDIHLNYINSTFGPPKDYIWGTSSSVYFNAPVGTGTPDQICDEMITNINNQIDNPGNASNRKAHIKKASDWQLPGGVTSYEGGPATPGEGSVVNLDNKILAHRTTKMKDVVIRNYKEAWFEIGGGLAMYFAQTSGYNRYGAWGMTDDYTKPDRNHKLEALNSFSPCVITSTDDKQSAIFGTSLFPNPFSTSATLKYQLKNTQEVTVKVYNQIGNMVSDIYKNSQEPGEHLLEINHIGLLPGVYYCVIGTDQYRETIKMIVIK